MNEKNKNEKTFADLFSAISENKQSEPQKEQTTLNDLFKNNIEENKIKFSDLNTKEEDNTITEEETKIEKEDNINFNNMIINSNLNEQEENKENYDLFSFNNNQEEPEEEQNIFTAPEEEPKDKDINTEENMFTSSKEEDEDAEPEEEQNIFTSPEKESEDKDIKQEENIFTSSKEEKEDTELEKEQNIFTAPEEEPEDKDINTEENIFSTSQEGNKESEETNMFLNESVTIPEDSNTNEETTEEIKEQDSEESPFFSDTIASDDNNQESDNPFFENKINLIENEKLTNNNTTIDTSNIKHFNVKVVNKKEPLIKFIIGVISYAIFILLLLIGITLLVYVADLKIKEAKGDTTPPKYNAFVVLTGSMLPEIQVYDVVVTKRANTEDLKEGDVITFSSSDSRFAGTTITHRIIKVNKPKSSNDDYTFQTKGDNNNVADSALVQANNIYGKVMFKIPKLGYLQEFLASDGGWILVILLPCLAVVSYDIVTLAKGIKRKKYKNLKVQK